MDPVDTSTPERESDIRTYTSSTDLNKKQGVSPPPPLPNDDICSRCKKVQWEWLVTTLPAPDQEGYPKVFDIPDSHEQLKSSSCRVCRILAKIKPPSLDGKPDCSLRAISAQEALRGPSKVSYRRCPSTFLFVTADNEEILKYAHGYGFPDGFLGLYKLGKPTAFGVRFLRPINLPFRRLQKCVAYCRKNHSEICSRKLFPYPQRLRAIDCEDSGRKLVAVSATCKYAALSYVWGKNTESTSHGFPQVVLDAVEATKLMGLRYLWVDRYCIDQEDPSDKHHQISQMGDIYANAEITFVAAAGKDSTHGLPGISCSQREQAKIVVDNIAIFEGIPHPLYSVKKCVWASRGWTYQEGLLSPRRLIFTDCGILYLCSGICLPDCIKMPLTMVERKSTFPFGGIIPTFRNGYRHAVDRMLLHDAESMLIEYSGRQLTYDEDVLNAVLGILQLLEGQGFYSAWGVLTTRMLYEWYHKSPTKRRRGFPSWSYLGWEGPIDLVNRLLEDVGYKVDGAFLVDGVPRQHLQFEVTLGDCKRPCPGEVITEDILGITGAGVEQDGQKLMSQYSKDGFRYLHLTGGVFDIPLHKIPSERWVDVKGSYQTTVRFGDNYHSKINSRLPDGVYAELNIATDIRMLAKVQLDKWDVLTRPTIGVSADKPGESFSSNDSFNRNNCGCILLFQARACDTCSDSHGPVYERVGLLWWRLFEKIALRTESDVELAFITRSNKVFNNICFPSEGMPQWLVEAKRKTIIVG
ncbi:HET-domain-containing protein [Hypomontagnella monticulosa]|nr:HET-domain-containing protein [Hypomontagnella monticulosa]